MEASLYIHIPFCSGKKCDYCDFYSIAAGKDDPMLDRYVTCLLLEAQQLFKKTGFPIDIPTVYIGGGTPSVLGNERIQKLLDGLSGLIKDYSPVFPQEITIEANPETIDRAFLEALSRGGVTRLSVGVQTFYAPSRRAVSRNGDEMQLPGQLALASEYFPGALSVDLITGLPHQNEKILLDDIAGVIDFKPAHVSLYALTMASKKSFTAPSTEEADNLWLCGRDALEKSGYCQYEVSNFCLPEKESLHNIRYWRMNNWLALGPSASGTIIDDEKGCGTRYTIPPDTETWLASKGCDFDKKGGFPPLVENLDKLTLLKESLLMGFRCVQGPDKDLFLRRFHVSIDEIIKKTIKKWRGSLNIQHGKIALTKDGLLFLNRFLIDAFEELDADFSPC